MSPHIQQRRAVHCVAIDLGATSGRVILGTWKAGKLALQEVHRFANTFRSLGPHDYWDLGTLWHEAQVGLTAAARMLPKGERIASVGVDTWGVDFVLVDEKGRMVYPVHAYRDRRTAPGLQKLSRTRAAAERIYAATGLPPLFYNSSLQLEETLAACPAVADVVRRCLFLPDYFNFLLSGRMANEISIASTSQLLDVHSRGWSRAALAHFHVPPEWFPEEPILAGTRLGKAAATIAGGAIAGAQVVAVPGHDTACAYDAMPAAEDGSDLFLSSGTWSLVGFESASPVLGAEALDARVANERTGEGGYRPLKNVIGLWMLEGVLKDFGARPASAREWEALIAAAAKAPNRTRLDVSDPAFANPASMTAEIKKQLRRMKAKAPAQLAGYVRLVIDSLAAGHAEAKQTFERMTGKTFGRILMVGGGSRNRLLCAATAEACGVPVVSFNLEGTAVGNLARQLIALGEVGGLKDFRRQLAPQLRQKRYLAAG